MMKETDITLLIREVLAEELARLRKTPDASAPGAQEERVSIASDGDLQAFAARMVKLAQDPRARQAFEAGRLVFRLAGGSSAPRSEKTATSETTSRIDKGFLSERQVDALPQGTRRLLLGKAVRLTPLAKDRLRQRGIAIERTGS